MRKIFIDGGANNGSSIRLFKNKFPHAKEYEIHSFECHPKMLSHFNKDIEQVTFYNKALSTSNGTANFYIGTTPLSSTLRTDKTSGQINYKTPVTVETVDLADFIKTTFNREDYIVLKLDVEGAEYDILPHLLEQGIFDGWVKELFGEYHPRKLTEITSEFHNSLVEQLASKGFKMKDWAADLNRIEF